MTQLEGGRRLFLVVFSKPRPSFWRILLLRAEGALLQAQIGFVSCNVWLVRGQLPEWAAPGVSLLELLGFGNSCVWSQVHRQVHMLSPLHTTLAAQVCEGVSRSLCIERQGAGASESQN